MKERKEVRWRQNRKVIAICLTANSLIPRSLGFRQNQQQKPMRTTG